MPRFFPLLRGDRRGARPVAAMPFAVGCEDMEMQFAAFFGLSFSWFVLSRLLMP